MAEFDKDAIERLLHDQIPLSREMGVQIVELSLGGVRLRAPLTPNVNHRHSAFGGSLSSLALLSGWLLAHLRTEGFAIPTRVVIQRNEIEYVRPAVTSFEAVCQAPDLSVWERLYSSIKRWGKGRVTLRAQLFCEGEVVAHFRGDYVVTRL